MFRCPFGLYCFWGTISRLLRMKISNEFSGLSYCLIIKVHCFCCPHFYRSSLTSLSQSSVFVKHFFELFWKSCFSKLSKLSLRFDSFHSITPKCYSVNTFFQLFFFLKISLKKERRKRDLNPRAAINDLLPFQGSPFGQLGYFSICPIEWFIQLEAERVGFEPTRPFGQTVFKTASLWPLRYLCIFTCVPEILCFPVQVK